MNRFKVGDRVAMVDNRSAVGVVDAVPVSTERGQVHVSFEGSQGWFPPSELMLEPK